MDFIRNLQTKLTTYDLPLTTKTVVQLFLLVLLGITIADSQNDLWVSKDGSIKNVDARALVSDSGTLYLATKNIIYKSSDIEDGWQEIFAIPAGENEIRCLAGSGKNVFVGTTKGLFRTNDRGATWRNVFKTITPEKSRIRCIELSDDPNKVLIGSEKGVFASSDGGTRWTDYSSNLKGVVNCLARNNGTIYAGAESGLYFRDKGSDGWMRLIVKSCAERSGEGIEPAGGAGEEGAGDEEGRGINCIEIKGGRIYAGSGKDIVYSDDGGKAWSGFCREGLTGTINDMLAARKADKLYCATTKGVFEYTPGALRWLELYRGMARNLNINKIAFQDDEEKFLWAVTEKGLYRLEGGRFVTDRYIDVEKNLKTLKIAYDNEPSFRELQQAAIRHAEVNPEKIAHWRNEARLKAFLPKVSLGLDNNRSTNAEIYTSATRDYIVSGPDDITDGWDVSVAWELADLVWSDDQANIDVRSRLMVQLRNDILDDLRRAYFERKRLQFEMAAEPPQDPKARFEKETRLAELTQAVDDLTGNYLSEHVRKSEDKIH